MKNAIQYYYQLYPNDIHQNSGIYEFEVKQEHYCLTPYNRSFEELEELYKISVQLYERQVYCHQFVPNIGGSLITNINQTPYVLLKIIYYSKAKVTIEDVSFFAKLTVRDTEKSLLSRNHWKELWMKKNDYFEYQVSQFGKSFPKIRESFSYFIGLSEIGIALLNEVTTEEPLVISHRRISRNDTLYDLYNPLNFVLDYKERDFIEFFKAELLTDHFLVDDFVTHLHQLQLTKDGWLLLLARAFYPTFYFDSYEQIIDHHKGEELLEKIETQILQYEQFLKIVYEETRLKHPLPDLWILKT